MRTIPTTLHQVWVGPKSIPGELIAHARTWAATHPTWDLVLWSDHPERHEGAGPWDEVRELPPIINAWAYEHAGRYVGRRAVWAARSDIVRMEIIAREGGVYADLDVMALQPMDALLRGVRLAVADELGPCNGNYLFAASPNHPALWTAVRELAANFPELPDGWHYDKGPPGRIARLAAAVTRRALPSVPGILSLTGPCYLNAKLQRHPDCVVWPWQLWNPLHARCDWRQVQVWPDSAFGNHCYAGTWYDQTKKPPPPEFVGRCAFTGDHR